MTREKKLLKASDITLADNTTLLREMRKRGIPVMPPGPTVKATFIAHQATLHAFKTKADKLEMKLQEALWEALDMWLESKEGCVPAGESSDSKKTTHQP